MSHRETFSDVLAANLRRVRKNRGLSVLALTERMKALGRPVARTTITKAEAEEQANRRAVSVDELVVLALALDTTPWHLLAPTTFTPVDLTPGQRAAGMQVGQWLRGEPEVNREGVLPGDLGWGEYLDRALVNLRTDAPPWAQHEFSDDDRMWAIDQLHQLVSSTRYARADPTTAAERAARLRRALARVVGVVELVVDRLDAEAGT